MRSVIPAYTFGVSSALIAPKDFSGEYFPEQKKDEIHGRRRYYGQ